MTTNEKSPRPGAYIHTNGLDIYYEEYGSGYPLLLIHSGLANHEQWQIHIPTLAKHFRVIAPDSRGHGRTKNPLDTMSYRLLADDMAALIQALGIQQPLVWGFSDGAQIELEMGMNYPQLAKAYVVDGAIYKWAQGYEQILQSWGVDAPGVVDMERLQRESPGVYQYLLTYQEEDACERYMRQASYMWLTPLHYSNEELHKISAPTLIISGDRDDFVPAEQLLDMYRALPNAELAIAPAAGHGFLNRKPEMVTAVVLDFFLRHSVPSA
jgi:pimeloyl-ACP methyl ester carboxylesterase